LAVGFAVGAADDTSCAYPTRRRCSYTAHHQKPRCCDRAHHGKHHRGWVTCKRTYIQSSPTIRDLALIVLSIPGSTPSITPNITQYTHQCIHTHTNTQRHNANTTTRCTAHATPLCNGCPATVPSEHCVQSTGVTIFSGQIWVGIVIVIGQCNQGHMLTIELGGRVTCGGPCSSGLV